MIYLLLIFLFIFMWLAFFIFKKGVLSPTFIVSLVFFFSSFYLLFYADKWNFNLHWNTLVIILVSICSLFFGELICHFTYRVNIKPFSLELLKINNLIIAIGFTIALVSVSLHVQQIISITNTNIFDAIEVVKDLKVIGKFQLNSITQHLYTITQVISCILIFYILNNFVNTGKLIKNPFIYLTIILYVCNVLLTATRANILELFVYMFVLLLVLTYRKKNRIISIKKIFLIIIIGTLLVFIIFYFAGNLTGKINEYNSIFDNLANYISSSIYNLDYFLQNTNKFVSHSGFGSHTLSGIYSFLETLGFKVPTSIVALEYVMVDYYPSNVFTPIRRYYQDFGMLGLIIIMFFIGFVFSYFIRKSLRTKNPLFIIIVSFFYYPLFFMSIEERVFMDVIMVRSVYQIIYFIVFYNLYFRFKTFQINRFRKQDINKYRFLE